MLHPVYEKLDLNGVIFENNYFNYNLFMFELRLPSDKWLMYIFSLTKKEKIKKKLKNFLNIFKDEDISEIIHIYLEMMKIFLRYF